MRVKSSTPVNVSNVTAPADYAAEELDHITGRGFSAHIIWTSTTATGTLKLQRSNDGTNWQDISGDTQAITNDSGNVLFDHPDVGYRYYRLSLSGVTGTITTLKMVTYRKG